MAKKSKGPKLGGRLRGTAGSQSGRSRVGRSSSARVQNMIGITRAKDIVMRSQRITGLQACDWGVAADGICDNELEAATDAHVNELRDFARLAPRTL
jgi:2-oxoglutaroyl-CoA hydrolase